MENKAKTKFPDFSRINFSKRKIAGIFIVLLILFVGIFAYNKLFPRKASDAVNTAEVTKGEITVSIEGSGVIDPIEMYNITSLATGDILKSDFEEGQKVEKGDLLYVIDTKDIDNTIEKAKVSLEKQQLSHTQVTESYEGLYAASPISGVITQCYLKAGDSVQKGSKIADIINSEYMILSVPFNSSDAKNIKVGSTARVSLENSSYELDGVVEAVASGEIVIESGATVSTVRIKVKNPGAITSSDKATAIIDNMACNSSGSFEYSEQKSVLAKTSGEVLKINYNTGDKVEAGYIIAVLESRDAEVSLKQSELSLTDAQLALQNTYDQLDNYNITSPIAGTVVQKTSKAGDTLDSSTKSTTMAIIADMSRLTFEIDVDELDIGKIELGQKVQVTADSLAGKIFEGKINNISAIGTSTNGVASYPVTVVMENTGDLMIGMNVNAQIVIESKDDVLRIPSSALYRGNRVLVKDTDGKKAASQNAGAENSKGSNNGNKTVSSRNNAPEGYTYVNVEIGISNTDYVEIVSGLSEGDVVVIPTQESTAGSQNQMMIRGVGIPGGGQMPQGGNRVVIPGGGMQ